jgi:hypothetical protein
MQPMNARDIAHGSIVTFRKSGGSSTTTSETTERCVCVSVCVSVSLCVGLSVQRQHVREFRNFPQSSRV